MTDDAHIVADAFIGGILARWAAPALRLIALKAFIEPLAVWAGRSPYRWLDRLLGGVLPGGESRNQKAMDPHRLLACDNPTGPVNPPSV
jgi:hypothetical protein